MKSPLKTKPRRWGFFLLILLALYALAVILIVPQFIKAPLNQQLQKYDLSADYQQLRINPLTLNIHIKQLQLQNRNQQLLTAGEATIDWKLLPLLSHTFNLDNLSLQDADIYIEFDQQNKLIKPQLPKSTDNAEASQWQFVMGQINIKNTDIHLQKGSQSYVIKQLNASHKPNIGDNNQPIDISLHTDSLDTSPGGQLTITGEQQNETDGWLLQWHLKTWPLKELSQWLLTTDPSISIDGQVSAQGQFTWLPDQLPTVTVDQLDALINQAHYEELSVENFSVNGVDFDLDFENKSITLNRLKSTQAHWQLSGEPVQSITALIGSMPNNNEAKQPWQWHIGNLEIKNWQLQTMNDNNPQMITVQRIEWREMSPQTLAAEVIVGQSKPLLINAEINQNPLSFSGTITSEQLNINAFNPVITAFSGWQLQQAELAFMSRFCYLNGQLNATGPWKSAQFMANNGAQIIDIESFKLATLHLDFNHQYLFFNSLTAAYGSGTEVNNTETNPTAENMAEFKPSEDSIETESSNKPWQVFIGHPAQLTCQTEPLGH